jgi:hypothetical protein
MRNHRLSCVVVLALPVLGQTISHNGIVLPAEWPPKQGATQQFQVPSYITSPPSVIPIDLGRQLFFDDFLIAETTLKRTRHQPVMYSQNPVLSPGGLDSKGLAMVFSDGVWFDPKDQLFKMWYDGSYGNIVSYATSADGKHWTRPSIPDAAVPGTNMVLKIGGGRDSAVTWLDQEDPDPSRRFKEFAYYPVNPTSYQMLLFTSPDGIHWSPQSNYINSRSDRTTLFWNPFRKVWVDSMRSRLTLPATPSRPSRTARARYYAESPDLAAWSPSDWTSSFWTGPDENDPPYAAGGAFPELYNLDAVAYESVLVGLFSWFYPDQDVVEIGVGFSRDGFQWFRPTRGARSDAFIPASNRAGTWNAFNTQSAGGGFLVVGDQLWFYFSGRDYKHGASGQSYTGLAMLRRDGFYSMDTAGAGTLLTRPVRFQGRHLFVNVDDPQGSLRVELVDPTSGQVIDPFSKVNSREISTNNTRQEVTWTGAGDLSRWIGRPVQIRFFLANGSLFSFWISDESGASHGYVAAGGPGFTGPTDTVGAGGLSH